jgi:uncharacterized membrane protein
MQRYLLISLILLNVFLMGAVVFIAPVVLKTANVAIVLSELVQANQERLNTLETDLKHYTDPETIQSRTIDYILRRGDFTNRP